MNYPKETTQSFNMCMMNTCNPSNPLTEQEQEKMAEFSQSVKLPMEKTIYFSSRTPLHGFKLPRPVWRTRKVLRCVETSSKIKNKATPVRKPCLRVRQSKRQPCSRPVDEGCEVVRRSVRRREGLFSLSLSKEQIEEDFVRVTGRMPEGKKKVKIFKDAKEERDHLEYQKYLKRLNPGSWLSEMYHV